MCVSVPARNHTEVLARSPESCKQYLMTTWRSERAPLARSRISRPHLAFVCLCVRRCFYDDCHAAAGATPQNSPLAYVSARVRPLARGPTPALSVCVRVVCPHAHVAFVSIALHRSTTTTTGAACDSLKSERQKIEYHLHSAYKINKQQKLTG